MQAVIEAVPLLGLFSLEGAEVILVLALFFILLTACGPAFPGRMRRAFKDARKGFTDATDDLAHDAGKSLGGIYGKPAAQAITPENDVAELYRPAVLEQEKKTTENLKTGGNIFRRILLWLRSLLWRR